VDGTPDASSNEDIVAELKRLRLENEVLRQERDILKRARFSSPQCLARSSVFWRH
jgi:transposase-like protein